MKEKLLLPILAAILMACNVTPFYLKNSDLSSLRKGMSPSQAAKLFEGRNMQTIINKEGVTVQRYAMLKGMRTESTVSCTPQGCFPIIYSVPTTVPYYFAFKNDRLDYWGDQIAFNRNLSYKFLSRDIMVAEERVKIAAKEKLKEDVDKGFEDFTDN